MLDLKVIRAGLGDRYNGGAICKGLMDDETNGTAVPVWL
jgi:hypothetical protein